jgi:hypothetical protein
MGKTSFFSRKTAWRRQKKRKQRQKEQKEIEIADLQIQLQEFRKNTEIAGEKLIDKLIKVGRENDNLLKWIDIYTKQISSQEEEIYKLQLKLYTAHQQSSSSQPPPPQSQPPPQSSSSQPFFKSLDEYFKQNNQVIFYIIFFVLFLNKLMKNLSFFSERKFL